MDDSRSHYLSFSSKFSDYKKDGWHVERVPKASGSQSFRAMIPSDRV